MHKQTWLASAQPSESGGGRFTLKPQKQTRQVTPAKLFADLLRRQARRVMGDVTECPVDTLPAHLARLDDLREVFKHVIRHDYAETPESRLSGAQLMYPATLADFLACLDITRQTHRAPAFVNQRDSEIADINRKLDLLAGLICKNPELLATLQAQYEQPEGGAS